MENTFTDKHLDRLLPDNLVVNNAEGDRLYASNGKVFYNFFNDSLRWLCGYDNSDINKQINTDIEAIQNNPNQIFELANQVKDVLCQNAGNKYNSLYFTNGNSYIVLHNRLVSSEKKFFITLSHNIYIPASLQESFITLDNLLEVEPDVRRSSITEEGWETKKIKNVFKHYKNRIAGFIISPLLLSQGKFLSQESCEFFSKLCNKYKVPIIWDESLTAFFRTGTFYFLNQYSIDPDFLTINANVSQNGSTHILIPTKKANRKYLRGYKGLDPRQNAPALIILHSDLLYIAEKQLPKFVEHISYRLTRKLNALSANVHNRFSVKSKGIIVFIGLKQENVLNKLHLYLINKNMLVFNNQKNSLLLLPQLTLSNRAADLLIQNIDDFFKTGLKLPVKK